MPSVILDIEVTEPFPEVILDDETDGVAVLLRRKRRPLAFWMEDAATLTNRTLTPAYFDARTLRHARGVLLRDSIREEIAPVAEYKPFPSLSVVICTRDRADLLARCLRSIQSMQRPLSCPEFEILVVDNATADDSTRNVVAEFQSVRYVHEPVPGLDTARNRGLQEASGDLVALLDDDVVADQGWLLGFEEAYSENPDAAVFTGLILPLELSTFAQEAFERRGGFRLAFGTGFEKARYGRQRTGDPGYPAQAGRFGAGANMTLNRSAILQLGGFDEALDTGAPLAGGGDLDMFYRVIRAGLPLVFEPRMLVFHFHRTTDKSLRAQYESWGKGYMAFVSKSYAVDPENRKGLRLAVRLWISYQAKRLIKSIRTTDLGELRYVSREVWGGVVGLLGAYNRSVRRMERRRSSMT